MGIQDHARWFKLSDGTNEVRANIFDCLGFNQNYEVIGGASVIRMMQGSALKQTNWQKLKTTLSGSGGLPFGFGILDYSKQITISCAVPRSLVKATNTFTTPTNARSDTGYEPYVLKMVEGYWLPLTSSGAASAYKQVYFPELVCFMDPPMESMDPDSNPPIAWSLTGEQI